MNKRKLWLIMAASLVVLAAVGTYAGWTVAGEPQAKSPARPTSSPPHPDPNGKSACDMVEDALQHKAWDDYGLALKILESAKASPNEGISGSAVLLELRLALVAQAQGQPNLAEQNGKLRENMEDLEHQCQLAGLL